MRLGMTLFVLLAAVVAACSSNDVPSAIVINSTAPSNVTGIWTIQLTMADSNTFLDTLSFVDTTTTVNTLTGPPSSVVIKDTVLRKDATASRSVADACVATMSDTITQATGAARLSGLSYLIRTCDGITDTVRWTIDTTITTVGTTADTTVDTTRAQIDGALAPNSAISLLFTDSHRQTVIGTRDSIFRRDTVFQTDSTTDSTHTYVRDTVVVNLRSKVFTLTARQLLQGTVHAGATAMSGTTGWTMKLKARPNKATATLLGTWTATKQ